MIFQEIAKKSAASARLSFVAAGAAALLASNAVPQAAESNIVLDNLTLTLGAKTYRVPHLELTGSTLTAADLADLFKGDEKVVDARLARFSARSLVIPAFSAEATSNGENERVQYRDLRAEDIRSGRIAALQTAGIEQTLEKANGATSLRWGATLVKGLDLRQLVHIALALRADPQEPLKPLVEEESVESLTLEDKSGRLALTTGRIAVTGVKGRALASPATQLLERLAKYEAEKPEADAALPKDLIDAIASFDVAAFDVRDIAANGKGETAEKPFSARIGRIAANRIAGATVGDFSLDGFSLRSSDGGAVALKRFSLRDARLASFIDNPVPLIGHIGIKGLEGDLPDARMGENSRMRFSLAGAEANFQNFREIAPTKFSARMDGLSIDLAARGEAPSTAQFLALGYRNLDLSAALAGEWREKTQEAVFAPLRFEGKDMGAATLDVTFGDVSSAVFSSMPVVAKAAALASSLKSISLTVEGGGLIDRVLAAEAQKEKQPLEKARAEYAKSAATVAASLLGGGDKAKKVSDALAAYIMKPRRLYVRLASEKGVNALDVMGKSFSDLFEALDVEATADK